MGQRRQDCRVGAILRQEHMMPAGLTTLELSRRMGVAPTRISEILKGKWQIGPLMARRLAEAFPDTTEDYWLGLQYIETGIKLMTGESDGE